MSVRVADTSALYALFSMNDVHHTRALDAIEDPSPILVPPEILSETLALIQYRHGFALAEEAGAFLRGLPHVEIPVADEAATDAAWDAFRDAGGRVSYPDATVVAACRREGADVLAFDKNIRAALRAKR